MTFHSSAFSEDFILASVTVDPGPITGTIGVIAGVNPELDVSLSKSTMYTHRVTHSLTPRGNLT